MPKRVRERASTFHVPNPGRFVGRGCDDQFAVWAEHRIQNAIVVHERRHEELAGCSIPDAGLVVCRSRHNQGAVRAKLGR